MHPTLMGLVGAQLYEERLRAREAERRAALARAARRTSAGGAVRRRVGLALVSLGRALGSLGERIASTADRPVGGLP
ncbi:hypothetical protein HRbin32_00648 [bacterium HR32]|jgi:hypothetical protein|nr:hypothetical protein HRbin32_00648 [bacterium HR32]